MLKTRKAKLSGGYSEQHIRERFANFFFRSTIFLQDGHEINEIPIVIRRMGPNEILFQNELYGGRPQLHLFSRVDIMFIIHIVRFLLDCFE